MHCQIRGLKILTHQAVDTYTWEILARGVLSENTWESQLETMAVTSRESPPNNSSNEVVIHNYEPSDGKGLGRSFEQTSKLVRGHYDKMCLRINAQ